MVKSLTAFDSGLPDSAWNAVWGNGYAAWKPWSIVVRSPVGARAAPARQPRQDGAQVFDGLSQLGVFLALCGELGPELVL